MRRIFLALAIVPALILTALPASAAGRTYVTYDCAHVKTEPRQILFACGDGAFFSDHLHWRKWHSFRAVGRGEFHQNDCRPDCARGTFHERDGKIVLHGRQWCAGIHKSVFAHARITFDGRLVGRHRQRFRLFCPMH
ncbi:MAG: hypothetical protein ACJ758_01930 [Actinomycetota bacterium]